MHKKKLIYLALAAILPMGTTLMAEEAPAAAEPIAPVVAPEPAASQEPADSTAPVVAPEPAVSQEVAPKVSARKSMEDRWKEREARYEALKKRAEESGVMLPDTPPWHDRQAMKMVRPDRQERMEHMKKMQAMTPEEREAFRLERYQEMRARAEEIGLEMPETPPWQQRQNALQDEWEKQQEVIKGMTDEERAACHAMHRREMRESAPAPMRGMRAPMYEGPGYGYGPGPYGPRGGFWDPAQ